VAAAGFVGAFGGGAFFAVWLKTGTAASTTNKPKILQRLRSEEIIPILLNDCPTLHLT
jgi:hypothetical protein